MVGPKAYWILIFVSLIIAPTHSSATLSVNPNDIENIKAAAEAGDSGAQYRLGLLHYHGERVEKDLGVGGGWFNKAAKQQNADAAYMISVMLHRGEGYEQTDTVAKEWLEYSSNLGSMKARRILLLIVNNLVPRQSPTLPMSGVRKRSGLFAATAPHLDSTHMSSCPKISGSTVP